MMAESTSRRAIVTGASGRIGRRLKEELLNDGFEVLGLSHDAASSQERLDLISEGDRLKTLLSEFSPQVVFHCAAMLHAAETDALCKANVSMLRSVVAAMLECRQAPLLVNLSSAAELGVVPPECSPVSESFNCQPVSGYGKSKLLQTEAALALSREHGFRCVCPRIFNVLGGQAQIGTAVGDWCAQVVRMQRGEQELVLKIGDLGLVRDFIGMDAVVDTLVKLAGHPVASGLVNVGSGVGTSYREIIELLRNISGLEFSLEEDPSLGRSGQRVPTVVADCGRLRELLGESPGFNLARAVEDCLTESRDDRS